MKIKAKIGEVYRYYSGGKAEKQAEDPESYKEVVKKEFFKIIFEGLAQ